MNKLLFKPFLGSESKISSQQREDGSVYFATDTGKIFLDYQNERINMGGAGAAIYYAKAAPEDTEAIPGGQTDKDVYWLIEHGLLVDPTSNPSEDDIILVITTGTFYKIEKIENSIFYCKRLSISGGGASEEAVVRPNLVLHDEGFNTNVINGSEVIVNFTATSKMEDGALLNPKLNVYWELREGTDLKDANNNVLCHSEIIEADSGEMTSINITNYLRPSTSSILYITASGTNHTAPSYVRQIQIITTSLNMSLTNGFSNITPLNQTAFEFSVKVEGSVDKYLEVKVDDKIISGDKTHPASQLIPATNSTVTKQIHIIDADACKHGAHRVELNLYHMINGERHGSAAPIKFEVAINGGEDDPIVWFGGYKDSYTEYESIQIPYLAYDPKSTDLATITLYKDEVPYKDQLTLKPGTEFAIWEISDFEAPAGDNIEYIVNKYAMSCGTTKDARDASYREITFKVTKDSRELTPVHPNSMRLNFDPIGRNNNESKMRRAQWSYTPTKSGSVPVVAKFDKFNWSNNGWMKGDNNKTKLTISNGATLEFPIGNSVLNTTSDSTQQSATFEFMFKIRNIQNYTDLVTNITRYNVPTYDDNHNLVYNSQGDLVYDVDTKYYEAFTAETQKEFTNYDFFLQAQLGADYDLLQFREVEKRLNLNNAICTYCSGSNDNVTGLAIGPQDAFFKDGNNTVSASYVENELVSLTIVYEKNSAKANMMYIYLNGVISGVSKSTKTSDFDIAANAIKFVSNNCDIDLYKVRVYNRALNVAEVVQNYSIDRVDINNFDLINLASYNATIGEYQLDFKAVKEWNKNHPDNQTMPYIIFDTTKTTKNELSYAKINKIPITVEFVNTQLDRAYEAGELEKLALEDKLYEIGASQDVIQEAVKTYYKHHCPSWTGDYVELAVQGTSSEFYPRRNYKIKTKTNYEDPTKKKKYQMFLHKGPFAQSYAKDKESTRQESWYMNNYTNGTDRWTMKVDFMESSGSYNAGFASMMGTAYTKHPLQDYIRKEAIASIKTEEVINSLGQTELKEYDYLAPVVTFTEDALNSKVRWEDYRTSLLGFPVMAFHKRGDTEDDYRFIGYYRMLLDKGSDDVLGFSPDDNVTAKHLGNKKVSKIAECWEFSNNNRTYCSYRDPYDRNVLSFTPKSSDRTDLTNYTARGIPIVADSFEYRYHDKEDLLDILYELGSYDDKTKTWTYKGPSGTPEEQAEALATFKKETGLDLSSTDTWNEAIEKMLGWYKNWEEVCQWIWSTCIDNVVSMGNYNIVQVGDTPFTTDGTLYVPDGEGFSPVESGAFDSATNYYKKETTVNENNETVEEYVPAYVYGDEKYKYESLKFYQNINDIYSLYEGAFNPDVTYYELQIDDSYKTKSNLLVEKATEFIEGTTYYTWDKSKTNKEIREGNPAIVEASGVTAQNFANNEYYVAKPVEYSATRKYTHDTQEYRADKFSTELDKHFDLEYLTTYFIMTEAFECYDSRGKNCMMASWGPHEANGNYIWYPIFYDIDTQLGINNTGIPSYTFNIDATLNHNFSTSDSILWNNLYSMKKGSIISTYENLRGETTTLSDPPLSSINNIEKWYLFKENAEGVTHNLKTNLVLRGLRPLIATNLDAWYKYITITNTSKGEHAGDTGYLNRDAQWVVDTNGTYFYALQGDRSQSRQSFLTKRLDYIDSWLGVKEYRRGGSNCIWGRVSANDYTGTSDKWREGWPEGAGETYWLDEKETQKRHQFDAEYWLNLTPIYSTYVTLSDDAAAYPSVRYDGITPVNFKINAISQGVKSSENYREQLLYIYGPGKMLDIGDMSNLYWREFKIEGDASKLTRLKLGHDGIVRDYIYDPQGNKSEIQDLHWKNDHLNQPVLPSDKDASGMPLLKEANFCNIQIQGGDPFLNLTSCEKLRNFRATGSNLQTLTFADGVALDTLYVPPTLTDLSLVNANSLENILEEYTIPTTKPNGELEALPGLYIEGFFEENSINKLTSLNLEGGALNYDSYKLLDRFIARNEKSSGNRVSMLNVNWTPFVQLMKGDEYDDSKTYYRDNSHYGLEPYTYPSQMDEEQAKQLFDGAVVRGEIYMLDTELDKHKNVVQRPAFELLEDLIDHPNFKSYNSSNKHPDFSGSVYINNVNQDEIDEAEIAELLVEYPGLKLFAANIKSAYSAQFVRVETDGSYDYVSDINEDKTNASVQAVSQDKFNANEITCFTNPYTLYKPDNDQAHYDFIGWSYNINPDLTTYSDILLKEESQYWGQKYKDYDWGIIKKGVYSQVYYAIFKPKVYKAIFLDNTNSEYRVHSETIYDPNGSYFTDSGVPEPVSKQIAPDEERHLFKGWTDKQEQGRVYGKSEDVAKVLINVSSWKALRDTPFYAVYQIESVYDRNSDYKYFTISNGQIGIKEEYRNVAGGKMTLPAKDQNGNYITGIAESGFKDMPYLTHIFFERDSNIHYTTVDKYAFQRGNSNNPSALKAVYLPDSIRTIGDSAFRNQGQLVKVVLNDNIQSIADNAFRLTSALELDHLPDSLTHLGGHCFRESNISIRDNADHRAIPAGITEIPDSCFRGAPNVKVNQLGSNDGSYHLQTIGPNAFKQTDEQGEHAQITDLYIYKSVKSIGSDAFTDYGSDSVIVHLGSQISTTDTGLENRGGIIYDI